MKTNEPIDNATARSARLYEQFVKRFQDDIVAGVPADGTTRIDVLEDLLLDLHQAQRKSDLVLAGELTKLLDEEEIIMSKKESS